ncbi:A24 family peptidase [Erwinia tasmaniensis]|uniref:A24 family peptidase n=1 Tax=Erwinia tasmaniensis TaxID=338565 RepID=UPI003A4E5C08
MEYWIKVIYILIALLLLYISLKDITTRTISHTSLIFLVFLLVALIVMQGRAPNVAAAFSVFIILFILFVFHVIGGGDVKLLTVLSLSFSNATIVTFILTTLFFGGLVAITGLIGFRKNVISNGVPYAVAISLAFILTYPITHAIY